jgi:hypothetical protein
MATWRQCSSCRAAIGFEQIYWECSVSTCARVARTGLFFCSVSCWEAHLPTMRHREAWAVEKRSPTAASWQRQLAEESGSPSSSAPAPARASSPAPVRTSSPAPVRTPAPAPVVTRPAEARPAEPRRQVVAPPPADEDLDDDDILVVVSKLKKYIRARSGMNTSDTAMPVLSAHIRRVCDRAIQKATEEGRKTVLDRDFRSIL